MGKATAIAWCDATFNPWWGCEKVSSGCAHCYAETFAKRTGHRVWGKGVPRRFFGDKHWKEPRKWNEDALLAGERRRVFCASMADVFEADGALVAHRERLWQLIESTPHLDWLLLTKRPENAAGMPPWRGRWPANVWLGTSVEDQERADERIPHLLATPAAVRFLSCEPLLGPVNGLSLVNREWERNRTDRGGIPRGISWVIAGGESGPGARLCNIGWIRSIVQQCKEAGVAAFVKQLGAQPVESPYLLDEPVGSFVTLDDGAIARVIRLRDSKGADPLEWPRDLRVQEFPS